MLLHEKIVDKKLYDKKTVCLSIRCLGFSPLRVVAVILVINPGVDTKGAFKEAISRCKFFSCKLLFKRNVDRLSRRAFNRFSQIAKTISGTSESETISQTTTKK